MNTFVSNTYYCNVDSVKTQEELAQEFYSKAMAIGDSSMELSDAQRQQINSYLDQAISLDPTYAGFHLARGALIALPSLEKAMRGETDPNRGSAIDLLARAIEMNPDFADEHFPAGSAQFLRGMIHFFDLTNAFQRGEFPTRKEFDLLKTDIDFAAEKGIPEAYEILNQINRLERFIKN